VTAGGATERAHVLHQTQNRGLGLGEHVDRLARVDQRDVLGR
jgi:hypothetical protein